MLRCFLSFNRIFIHINNSERLKLRLMDSEDGQALWEIDKDPIGDFDAVCQ